MDIGRNFCNINRRIVDPGPNLIITEIWNGSNGPTSCHFKTLQEKTSGGIGYNFNAFGKTINLCKYRILEWLGLLD